MIFKSLWKEYRGEYPLRVMMEMFTFTRGGHQMWTRTWNCRAARTLLRLRLHEPGTAGPHVPCFGSGFRNLELSGCTFLALAPASGTWNCRAARSLLRLRLQEPGTVGPHVPCSGSGFRNLELPCRTFLGPAPAEPEIKVMFSNKPLKPEPRQGTFQVRICIYIYTYNKSAFHSIVQEYSLTVLILNACVYSL